MDGRDWFEKKELESKKDIFGNVHEVVNGKEWVNGMPATASGNEARRYGQALQMFQETGTDLPFDKFFEDFKSKNPKQEYLRSAVIGHDPFDRFVAPSVLQYPVVIQSPMAPAPAPNDNMLRELRDKMSGLEKENKEFQEYIKKLMLTENPRVIRSLFPVGRTYFDPKLLVDAVVSDEYEKRRIAEQTLSKLRDIYGEDAPGKYLERSLARIELPKVNYTGPTPSRPQRKSPPRAARTRSRSRSKGKTPAKKKSPTKSKKSTRR